MGTDHSLRIDSRMVNFQISQEITHRSVSKLCVIESIDGDKVAAYIQDEVIVDFRV